MKWQDWIFLFPGLFLFSGLAGQPKGLERYVARMVYQEIDFNQTPGVLVGVIEGDSAFVFAYESMDFGSEEHLTSETIFELGSVTKVFTASLLQVLVDEGILSYDDPLSLYFSFPKLNFNNREITLGDLSSHLSGLPKLPLNFGVKEKDPRNPYANYKVEDLESFLGNYYLSKEPGTTYSYSHTGYALIALIMEKATGQSYSELLQQYLTGPLGLSSTNLTLGMIPGKKPAPGYSLAGLPAPIWTFQCFEASMGLKSTMDDLIAFCKAQMDDNSPISKSLAETQKFVAATDKKKVSVGRGWHLVQPRKKYYPVVLHSGGSEGHRVFMAFIKETKTAVIVLSNSEHAQNGVGGYVLQFINRNFKLRLKK